MPSTATPVLLTDPGYLFWAPLLSTEPTNTVTGSKFTDAWPVAWISLGATEDGSVFGYQTTLEAVSVAEFFDPIAWKTTGRQGKFAFSLASYTLSNVSKAMNGAAPTVVSGTGATQLNKFEPPDPGSEVRAMLGWESLDGTVRLVARQAINGGNIEMPFKKAPSKTVIPCEFQLEVPSAAKPFSLYSAGTSRA